LLQLCANQTALIVENLDLRLVAERMHVWEHLSREMARRIRNPITLMGLWLEELSREISVQGADSSYAERAQVFLGRMKSLLDEADAAVREFPSDFAHRQPQNRVALDARKLVRKSLADIPHDEHGVTVEGGTGLIFGNRHRLQIALRSIAHSALSCLSGKGKMQVEIDSRPREDMPVEIRFVFPRAKADQLSASGSVLRFGQEDIVRTFIILEGGEFFEAIEDGRQVIRVVLPRAQPRDEAIKLE
jgi:hypothetical protein